MLIVENSYFAISFFLPRLTRPWRLLLSDRDPSCLYKFSSTFSLHDYTMIKHDMPFLLNSDFYLKLLSFILREFDGYISQDPKNKVHFFCMFRTESLLLAFFF
jgi:hypothetical protein